jgi:hypothetical protein
MEYRCETISMSRLNINSRGVISPLCDTCKTKDCSNPIEKKRVSMFGAIKEIRVFNRGMDYVIVIGCEGYLNV